MKEYINKFVKVMKMCQSANLFTKLDVYPTQEEYLYMLNNNKSLTNLATNPLMIRILIGIMPILQSLKENAKLSKEGVNSNSKNA